MTQIENQGATTTKTLPLGSGKPSGTPAGDGTFLAFMGQTPLPAPQPPLPTPTPTPENVAQLPPDMPEPDSTDGIVHFETRRAQLPDPDEALIAALQPASLLPDLAGGPVAAPAQIMLATADSPTMPSHSNAATRPAQSDALPNKIPPLARLPTQPAEPVTPASNPLQTDVKTEANSPSALSKTAPAAQPESQASALDKANLSAANQPPMAIAESIAPKPLSTPSPDAPAPYQTAKASISTPLGAAQSAPNSADLVQPKGAIGLSTLPVAPQNAALPPALLSTLTGLGLATAPPEQPTLAIPTASLTPPKFIADPRALAFAGALSAYKATESQPSAAIVQTSFAPHLQATSLNSPGAMAQAALTAPFPSGNGLGATSVKTIPALAALPAISAETSAQTGTGGGSQSMPITSIAQPTLTATQPPPPQTSAPPIEIAQTAMMERQTVADSMPIPGHSITSTPPLTPTALHPPVPMPALVQHIRQHAGSGKPTTTELALAPEELGKLRITMTPDGDKLRIVIQAERPETLELLRRNSESFTADLRQSGFAGASFSFGGWGDQPPSQQAKNQNTAAQPFGINREIAAPPKPYGRSPKTSGLDLRV